MQKIIFSDTNKIVGYVKALSEGYYVHHHIYSLTQLYQVRVSNYIVYETWKTVIQRFDLDISMKEVARLLSIGGIKIVLNDSDFHYQQYVHDMYDAQIIADAIKVGADYIYTSNLKDFRISRISQELHIIVTDYIS